LVFPLYWLTERAERMSPCCTRPPFQVMLPLSSPYSSFPFFPSINDKIGTGLAEFELVVASSLFDAQIFPPPYDLPPRPFLTLPTPPIIFPPSLFFFFFFVLVSRSLPKNNQEPPWFVGSSPFFPPFNNRLLQSSFMRIHVSWLEKSPFVGH